MDFNSYFTDKTDVKGLQNALEDVFNIDFISDRAVELQGLKEHYTGLGGKATDFNRLAKAYQQERDDFDKPVQGAVRRGDKVLRLTLSRFEVWQVDSRRQGRESAARNEHKDRKPLPYNMGQVA